jgi:hypothetical protein
MVATAPTASPPTSASSVTGRFVFDTVLSLGVVTCALVAGAVVGGADGFGAVVRAAKSTMPLLPAGSCG